MNSGLRSTLIKMAEAAQNAKILPIEGYFIDFEKKAFFGSLNNRPPKAFADDDKPLDMDFVWEIKKYDFD